jgi:Universal stress protein family
LIHPSYALLYHALTNNETLSGILEQGLDQDRECMHGQLFFVVLPWPTLSVEGAIADYAKDQYTDLIVVGARGRSGFIKLLLGSVASKVVTYAKCPVLVVKCIRQYPLEIIAYLTITTGHFA